MDKKFLAKALIPSLIIVCIFAANIFYKITTNEGTASLITDENYPLSFAEDTAKAKYSIRCAINTFQFDDNEVGNIEEPVGLIGAALAAAAKRGIKTEIIMNTENEDNPAMKKSKKAAEYLEEKGVRVIFDDSDKSMNLRMCIIDSVITYIGSHNFTANAMKYNKEATAKIISQGFAADAEKYLKKMGL